MRKRKLLIIPLFLLLSLSCSAVFHPVMAATSAVQAILSALAGNIANIPAEFNFPEIFPQDIFPLAKTAVELNQQKVTLHWSETMTNVQGFYKLVNPLENKTKLKIGLPNITPALQVYRNEEEIETTYNPRLNAHVWELTLEAQEEVDLKLNYSLDNIPDDEQGLCKTGFRFNPEKTALWGNEISPFFTLTLFFQDTHPGQILNLAPHHYQFEGNTLVWEQETGQAKEDILILTNPTGEINSWQNLLSPYDKTAFEELLATEKYEQAANFLENKTRELKNSRDKYLSKLGQAYYLKKAGYTKKSLALYRDLADHDETYPRIYWELGKEYANKPGKLLSLLNEISELKVHALLQPWLIAQLPPEKIKYTAPEITVKYTDPNINKKGITIKGFLNDKDGDIDKVTLYYNWEDEQTKEITRQAQQFNYEYEPIYFLPAPGPFQHLYYELKAVDYQGNETSTGKKEAFYLNEDLQSETFILEGANLILVSYTPHEQNKLYAWFKSYLNIVKEIGFVPIEAKSPLFIFLGKDYEFAQNYDFMQEKEEKKAPFMLYTPAPFSSQTVKTAVHRYFLSYWYGSGWNSLPEKELTTLGNALLLGKNPHALVLRYLQKKDEKLFFALLNKIGEGYNWREALKQTYLFTPTQLILRTFWHLTGAYISSLLIIISLAWFGKHGYLTKFIRKLQ